MATAIAMAPVASAQETTDGPLVVWNPILAASVQRLAAESHSWRDAIAAVAATGRRAMLVTTDDAKGWIEQGTLAQLHPLSESPSRIDNVLIVVNLELLQKLSGLPTKAIDFEDDVDRIVAHEVYGHAVPLLLSGTVAGNCADPAIGQSAIASCAIQRENVIRREMRLGQRVEYGRDSLALAPWRR
ncbi:MAG TPA: hypothetical protein VF491_23480 [Vicinamibacterales bacterium]